MSPRKGERRAKRDKPTKARKGPYTSNKGKGKPWDKKGSPSPRKSSDSKSPRDRGDSRDRSGSRPSRVSRDRGDSRGQRPRPQGFRPTRPGDSPSGPRFGGKRSEDRGEKSRFQGVHRIEGKLATKNSSPGYKVYDEKLVKRGRDEYRIWDPYRSKVAAALAKGLKEFPVREGSQVLYLGASSGTTASHIADIAGTVWCVEFSKRMMRELLPVCEKKENMVPILADARHPWEYANSIGDVDVLIQDVAQPDQAGILLNNHDTFGFPEAMLSIKARSINSAMDPKKVFATEIDKLAPRFEILQKLDLAPFEEDHVLVNLRQK